MYSTYDGAKKRAKQLKRLFDDSGFVFTLHQAQTSLARAGGLRDWHELQSVLSTSERPTDAGTFRRRLLAALPGPCHSPARAWLDGELNDTSIEEGVPPRYFRDVFPYVMAATALHRSRTALLRPGSGVGQRLRESLVVGLLLNIHGGKQPWPRLDPNTLALVFEGDLERLFKADAAHPRFADEFRRLQDAGILKWSDGRLQVMPPDADALTAHVNANRVGKAEHWMDSDSRPADAADALRDALAAIGIDNARRVADSVAEQDSDAYITPSGAVLTLLTDLAEQGDIATLARAYGLFAKIHPANSRYVRDGVPAKILSVYFTRRLRLTAAEAVSWTRRAPHWETELKAALSEPSVFVSTVERMSGEIRAAA